MFLPQFAGVFSLLVTYVAKVLNVLHLQWAKDQMRFHLFIEYSKNKNAQDKYPQ